jgi:hypothetical protein
MIERDGPSLIDASRFGLFDPRALAITDESAAQ